MVVITEYRKPLFTISVQYFLKVNVNIHTVSYSILVQTMHALWSLPIENDSKIHLPCHTFLVMVLERIIKKLSCRWHMALKETCRREFSAPCSTKTSWISNLAFCITKFNYRFKDSFQQFTVTLHISATVLEC